MRVNDQKDIIEQLLGITILSEKAEVLKDKLRQTREAITDETARINAIETSNERIGETIRSLQTKQSAWSTKQKKI